MKCRLAYRLAFSSLVVATIHCFPLICRADLLGYWSADSTNGLGTVLVNDAGDTSLNGDIVEATYTASGGGHTGQPGDFALSFPGEDTDYVAIPPTEKTFDEITISAWVKGQQMGNWAGLVVSRTQGQPIGLDFHDFDSELTYIWNNDSAQTWGFVSGVPVPENEWTFVALTITPDGATLYAGPKGGALVSAANEIPHDPQDNFEEWRLAEDNCCGPSRNFGGLMDDVSIWDEALTTDEIKRLHAGSATPLTLRGNAVVGDFDKNGVLDLADIDALSAAARGQANPAGFDLNQDQLVNAADRAVWVEQLKKTWFGDANLDGQFNSTDFVAVFQIGEYEDAANGNSGWADGDWNGDGDFNSSDFVAAFQGGGFEAGPRAATAAVPEPASMLGMILCTLTLCRLRRPTK